MYCTYKIHQPSNDTKPTTLTTCCQNT